MENIKEYLDKKFLGLRLSTWIVIAIIMVYLYFCKECKENFSPDDTNVVKVYNFNTTWCGYSVRFQPVWDEFHKKMNNRTDIQTFDVKCDDQEDEKVKELCERYQVQGYPTVVYEKGDKIIHYDDERSVKKLETKAVSMLKTV